MGIEAVGVIVVPVICIPVLPFVSQLIGICALMIVKEFVGPTDETGSRSWTELVWCVALTSNVVGFSAQGAPLPGVITATRVPRFFILAFVDPS